MAAQIYDKLRFRIVTRTPRRHLADRSNYLMRRRVPVQLRDPGRVHEHDVPLPQLLREARRTCRRCCRSLQLRRTSRTTTDAAIDNRFTATNYRVVHFVVDMPVRLPQEMLDAAPPAAWALGRVIFVQTEFQIIDRETEQANELGEASHAAYKERQKRAVMRRLKVGLERPKRRSVRPRPSRRPPKKR